MRTILVAAALRDREGHDAAVALLLAKSKPGVRVVPGLNPPPEGIDWESVRAAEGGWDGAYEWAARAHDGICAVPVDGDAGISRGVYAMVNGALALGKPVLICRRGALARVAAVRVVNKDEYKGVYGICVEAV